MQRWIVGLDSRTLARSIRGVSPLSWSCDSQPISFVYLFKNTVPSDDQLPRSEFDREIRPIQIVLLEGPIPFGWYRESHLIVPINGAWRSLWLQTEIPCETFYTVTERHDQTYHKAIFWKENKSEVCFETRIRSQTQSRIKVSSLWRCLGVSITLILYEPATGAVYAQSLRRRSVVFHFHLGEGNLDRCHEERWMVRLNRKMWTVLFSNWTW